MQTFLPYPDFEKSVQCLDFKRLGKQRVEAFQILNIILNRTKTNGWRNHPVIKMWENNPNALKLYFNLAIKEWMRRGYRNNMKLEKIKGKIAFPVWIGGKKFHASHRSNLLRKNKGHYSRFKWKEKSNLDYYWPI
jgi:Pyrimidine dimer DNA glycosylase